MQMNTRFFLSLSVIGHKKVKRTILLKIYARRFHNQHTSELKCSLVNKLWGYINGFVNISPGAGSEARTQEVVL